MAVAPTGSRRCAENEAGTSLATRRRMLALPIVTLTEPALEAIRDAAIEAGSEDVLHLVIDSRFQSQLHFAAIEPTDVVVTTGGLTVAMDRSTALRADGLTIDFLSGQHGVGFKLHNPNESSAVKATRPAEVAEMLRKREKLELVDVREPAERAKANLDAARALDAAHEAELLARSKDTKLVFICHHSRRSRRVAQRFHERGFTNVWYVLGGFDAWSTVDPTVPRY